MSETIILINESKRAWSLPGRAIPEREEPKNRGKLDERGRPRIVTSSLVPALERVVMFRPPLLGVGERVTVPRWYFESIRPLRSLAKVWGRRKDGIAVGRTREERANDAASDSRRELDELTRARTDLERRTASLEADLADAHKELAEKSASKSKLHEAEDRAEAQSRRAAKAEADLEKSKDVERRLVKAEAEAAQLKALLEKATAPSKGGETTEPDKGRSNRNG